MNRSLAACFNTLPANETTSWQHVGPWHRVGADLRSHPAPSPVRIPWEGCSCPSGRSWSLFLQLYHPASEYDHVVQWDLFLLSCSHMTDLSGSNRGSTPPCNKAPFTDLEIVSFGRWLLICTQPKRNAPSWKDPSSGVATGPRCVVACLCPASQH